MRRIASSKFNNACKLHDEDYGNEDITRFQADVMFYRNMLTEAGGSLSLKMMALLYFVLARAVGDFCYDAEDGDE